MPGTVTSLTVERQPEGTAKVRWLIEGECTSLDLAWGQGPEPTDLTSIRSVRPTVTGEVIEGLADGPLYVSVSPIPGTGERVAGIRNLGLAGTTNFRDLGGYRASGDATVRWGRIFRSDALLLEDSALSAFGGLHVRTIYDLRSEVEREQSPNRLPAGNHVITHLPVVGEESAREAIEAGLEDGEAFLARLYVQMLEDGASSFGALITDLADLNNLPAVFHCAAGKDRTGMAAALLLLALGVDEKTVLDDYELTSTYRTSDPVKAVMARLGEDQKIPAEAVAGILRTPRWAMKAAIDAVNEHHGGIDGYFTGPGGADAGVLSRLREVLLIREEG